MHVHDSICVSGSKEEDDKMEAKERMICVSVHDCAVGDFA